MKAETATSDSLRLDLRGIPRIALCHLPTPLHRMENLSRQLKINLYVKRDDQTGLAFGGNKSRKLEFILADALAQGADCIITWAGMQSNWCRQVAAAARAVGIQPMLVLFKRPSLPGERDGNVLLDELLGADITGIETADRSPMMRLDDVRRYLEPVAKRAMSVGRRPYIAPIGGSQLEGSMHRPLGAIGYVNAMLELSAQAREKDLSLDYLIFATASGSTHAGLAAGAELLSAPTKVIGITLSESREEMQQRVAQIATQVLSEFPGHTSEPIFRSEDVAAIDDYVGEGYGKLNRPVVGAIRRVAESDGLLLDPVYTGKAMSGVLDLAAKGYFESGKNVIFLHTGGTPALFSYGAAILQQLGPGL